MFTGALNIFEKSKLTKKHIASKITIETNKNRGLKGKIFKKENITAIANRINRKYNTKRYIVILFKKSSINLIIVFFRYVQNHLS